MFCYVSNQYLKKSFHDPGNRMVINASVLIDYFDATGWIIKLVKNATVKLEYMRTHIIPV